MSEATTAPKTATIRLPEELVRKLAIIGQRRDKTIGEIIDGWVGARVAREYRAVVDEMSRELGGES